MKLNSLNMGKTKKRQCGDIGENIAARFLMKHGFRIIGRNYSKPWGEIDLIAQKGELICFVEVKTVSCGTLGQTVPHETKTSWFHRVISQLRHKHLFGSDSYKITEVSPETLSYVSHETGYRPEDNLHPQKLKRLKRTIQTYMTEKGKDLGSEWRFDALCVYLNEKDREARVEWLQDIIL